MNQRQLNLQASILDRLIDDDPRTPGDSVSYRLLNMAQIKAAVIRDLENLLNTRRQIIDPPAECSALRDSLYSYGLKDFTAENPNSIAILQQLRQDIEQSVARFEPRLRNVRVHLENKNKGDRKLRFRITGLLVVEPISEPVTFDSFFDFNRGECAITG